MISLFQKRGFVGVDLGSQSVKVAQVQKVGNRTRLCAASISQRKRPFADSETTLSNPRSSQEEINSARVLAGSIGGSAACVVSMLLCDLRQLSISDGTADETQTMIERELEVQGHGALVAQQFDYWDVRVPGEAHPPKENLSVLSLATDWTEQIAEDLRKSRLSCMLINGLPQALAYSIQLSGQAVDETTAVVDWGHSCATFVLVHLGRPIFVRQLRRCGLTNLLEAIARSLEIAPDEAQIILRKHGVVEPDSSDDLSQLLGNIVARPMQQIVEEINRTLVFLKSHRRVAAAKKVILTGGGAAVPNAAEYLDRYISIVVEPWHASQLELSEDIDEDQSLAPFATSIALSSLAWVGS